MKVVFIIQTFLYLEAVSLIKTVFSDKIKVIYIIQKGEINNEKDYTYLISAGGNW